MYENCPRRDLNPQPIGYEPTALTIELQGLKLVQYERIELSPELWKSPVLPLN